MPDRTVSESRQQSVLIIEPDSIPQALQDEFDRSHWVETARLAELASVLGVAEPDQLLCRQRDVKRVMSALRAAGGPDCQVVVVMEAGRKAQAPDRLPPGVVRAIEMDEACDETALAPATIPAAGPTIPCPAPVTIPSAPAVPLSLTSPGPARPRLPSFRQPVHSKELGRTPASAPWAPSVRPPQQPSAKVLPFNRAAVPGPGSRRPGSLESEAPDELRPPSSRRPRRSSFVLEPTSDTPGLALVLRAGSDLDETVCLARALRKAGHRLLIEKEPARATAWHNIRKFSPHAVVTTEKAACEDGGEWLQGLRSDAFLSHVTLATIADSGSVSLGHLSLTLNAVASFEADLRAHLNPGRQVAFDLRQIGLSRLLRLLCEEATHAKILMGSAGQLLSWGIRDGQATEASLKAGDETSMEPAAALEWLLEHPDARVVLQVVDELDEAPCELVRTILFDAFLLTPPPFQRQSGFRRAAVPPRSNDVMEAPVPPGVEYPPVRAAGRS